LFKIGNLRFGWLCRVVNHVLRSRSHAEKVTVLGRVWCVNQQPSCEPEVGDEGGKEEQPGDNSFVTGPEKEQAGVNSVTESSEGHGVSHVTREDTPQKDSGSEKEQEDTSEDLLEEESVSVHQQKKVGKLSSDRRKVVGVEVLLDDFV